MTFTEFLKTTPLKKSRPAFLLLAHCDAEWPRHSNRLEDFESFLLARLEEESEEVVPELRDAWRAYARSEPNGKHDQDLALAAWADYARHLRTCSGTAMQPCETAEQLLERALEESDFEDHAARAVLPCEGIDAEQEDEDDLDDEEDDFDDVGRWDADDERC